MIEISESTENLCKAAKEYLYLYAPLGLGDQINLEARYWSKVPYSKDDVKLCKVSAFGFAIRNNNCSKILSYSILVPETWAEAQIREHNKPMISYELERIYDYKKPSPTTFSELKMSCQQRKNKPLVDMYFVTLYTLEDTFCFLKRELRECNSSYKLAAFTRSAILLLSLVFAVKIYRSLSILGSRISFMIQHCPQLFSMPMW